MPELYHKQEIYCIMERVINMKKKIIILVTLCLFIFSGCSINTNKNIVVYFSYSGNTEKVANKLSSVLDCDALEIQAKDPYKKSDLTYDPNCRAGLEKTDDTIRPKIKNDLSEVEKYENVYIGYPVWFSKAPRIIQTFIETYDLNDKNIYLFCTSDNDDIKDTKDYLEEVYPKLHIIKAKRFDKNVKNTDLEEWAQS